MGSGIDNDLNNKLEQMKENNDFTQEKYDAVMRRKAEIEASPVYQKFKNYNSTVHPGYRAYSLERRKFDMQNLVDSFEVTKSAVIEACLEQESTRAAAVAAAAPEDAHAQQEAEVSAKAAEYATEQHALLVEKNKESRAIRDKQRAQLDANRPPSPDWEYIRAFNEDFDQRHGEGFKKWLKEQEDAAGN